MKKILKAYRYPLKTKEGKDYEGYYTIYDEVERLRFKGERLVATFEIEIATPKE